MSLITDIVIAVPIGVVLNIFVHQLSYVLFNDLPFKEKFQKSLVTVFIAGILSITLALTIFSNHGAYKNSSMKLGFIIGGALLLFYSIFYNWDKMEDYTKLIIFGLVLGGLVFYCYKQSSKSKPKSKSKKHTRNKTKSKTNTPKIDK